MSALNPALFPERDDTRVYTSRALVVCHRCWHTNSVDTGAIWNGLTLVASVLDVPEAEALGLGALSGDSDVEGFFRALGVDRLPANGNWLVEVRVDLDAAVPFEWVHFKATGIRRPSDEELVVAIGGKGGWEVL